VYGHHQVLSSYLPSITTENIPLNTIRHPEEAQMGRINIINCWEAEIIPTPGVVSEASGKCAHQAIDRAIADLKTGALDGLVTAPVHKAAMQQAGFPTLGHTEYITRSVGSKFSLMLMVADNLRVGLATNHLPLKEVPNQLTTDLIYRKIKIMSETLKVDFGIERPTIAVLGLNPHAGDQGAVGEEDRQVIAPAIQEAKNKGLLAFGPFPADGFFGSGQHTRFNGVLAMYHDQGLIPFKTIAFGAGVNYTAGLSVSRTSPDHGTALDIAGQNKADETSLIAALYLAADIIKNRQDFVEMRANSLEKRKLKSLESETGEDEDMEFIMPEE